MPDPVDLHELCEYVAGFLLQVPGIGKVSPYQGDTPTWTEQPHRQAPDYWEVDVSAIGEELIASRCQAVETLTIRIEGWLPRHIAGRSHETWRVLINEVRRALREHETLGQNLDRRNVPQMPVQGLDFFREGDADRLCHHCIITFEAQRDFDYDTE
jgi:hypothetical protein